MTTLDLALLVLRIAIGLTFAAHGAQKAFGWWGGPGPANWTRAIQGMGFHPPGLFAAASIGAELVAGLALAVGFMTPIAAAVIVAQAIVIAVQVHLPHGFFSTNGGWEFPFVLGAAALAITLAGPGALSLDAVLGFGLDATVRLGLAIAGLAGGVLAIAARGLASPKRGSAAGRPLGRA